jgi:hypothetical protein
MSAITNSYTMQYISANDIWTNIISYDKKNENIKVRFRRHVNDDASIIYIGFTDSSNKTVFHSEGILQMYGIAFSSTKYIVLNGNNTIENISRLLTTAEYVPMRYTYNPSDSYFHIICKNGTVECYKNDILRYVLEYVPSSTKICVYSPSKLSNIEKGVSDIGTSFYMNECIEELQVLKEKQTTSLPTYPSLTDKILGDNRISSVQFNPNYTNSEDFSLQPLYEKTNVQTYSESIYDTTITYITDSHIIQFVYGFILSYMIAYYINITKKQ